MGLLCWPVIPWAVAPRAGRNSARFALATDLPASVLARFTGTGTGTGTSNATSWTGYVRRDWLDIASRTQI
ncbi:MULTISPECIES: hypothetical protein [Streptomyces]|uniref:hypothetical protein n=1 Tax=Streptomyces TaxID=1883 RepID=UPI002810E737|nr:hypothetical protein [Streptomyces sp.]